MIKNLSKGTIVSKDCLFLKSYLDKSIGMIKKRKTDAVFFKSRFGIHTFFMKTDIGVLILDNENMVKSIKMLKPNMIYVWNPAYQQVIELDKRLIKTSKTAIGDKLKIEN